MKIFSKMIALGLAATIIGSLFVGCGKKEPIEKEEKSVDVVEKVEKQPVEEKQEAVTIRIVSQFGGEDKLTEIYQGKLDEFRDENPHITIEDELGVANEEWKAKIATDFLVDNEPDIILTFTGKSVKTIIEQGKLVSIEEIRKEYPDYVNNISNDALNSVKAFDHDIYAVPVRGFYQGLFVNQAIFKENDLELPTDWEKLETAITILSENGKIPIAAALGDQPHCWIEHLILGQGGASTYENMDIMDVKEDWIKGLEYFKVLYDLRAFPKNTNSIDHETAVEMFIDGEAAMLLDGNELMDRFEDLEDIMVLPFPAVPGGRKRPDEKVGGFQAGWYITKKAWDDPLKRPVMVKFVEKMTNTQIIGRSTLTEGLSKNLMMPIESWLPKSAWEELVREISDIATGRDEARDVVDKVMMLH